MWNLFIRLKIETRGNVVWKKIESSGSKNFGLFFDSLSCY